ncbi:calcium-binding protein [Salinilacihabitans rarus]|uniref:calcium-binding protein n=1 Tax=Salinilacihabitans rarus TaxID=2961596 RepID=UPI0020C8C79D|nr:calcium-binding protein [Salinilacihabitans rarus]
MTGTDRTDETRRRTLGAAGGLAAGALATGTAAARTRQDTEGRVLVFSGNYFPSADFEVIGELQVSAAIDILRVDGEEVSEISDPTDWTTYIIRYDMNGEDVAGVTTFLFSEDVDLDEGDTATLSSDSSMYSPDLNLLETELGDDADVGDDEDEDDEDEDDFAADDEDDDFDADNETDDGVSDVEHVAEAAPCDDGEQYDWCQ